MSFADDSLLFCGATVEECGKVLNILEAYEGASGEKVNRSKIALFFSKSTTKDIKSNIKLVLGVSEILVSPVLVSSISSGEWEESKFQLHQRKVLAKTLELGRKATLPS